MFNIVIALGLREFYTGLVHTIALYIFCFDCVIYILFRLRKHDDGIFIDLGFDT